MKRRLIPFALLLLMISIGAGAAHANSFVFTTPAGSNAGGGPVSATAMVTTGAGTVTIMLSNLQANITDVAQAISDFAFTLSGGATTGTVSSSSGQEITIASNGTFTLGSTVATGWGLDSSGGTFHLCVLGANNGTCMGTAGPAHLIIGPPAGGGTYTAANGSIAGNGPHNAFLNQSATFTLAIAGVTAATNVTSATFSFGTTAGANVPGTPTPEPGTLALFGTGLLGCAGLLRRWLAARG
jgi:hypothetical protein